MINLTSIIRYCDTGKEYKGFILKKCKDELL